MSAENPLGLSGIAFIQYASLEPDYVDSLFTPLGLSKTHKHASRNQYYYHQNDVHFLLDHAETGFERAFAEQHGHSVCAMGWRVADAQKAHAEAIKRGAEPFNSGKYGPQSLSFPAIFGIGDSIIYFVDSHESDTQGNRQAWLTEQGFQPLEQLGGKPVLVPEKGFLFVDHLTNNVYKGTMAYWADFYKDIFGFTEVRYFDIKGAKTGLTSFALKSPCKTFSIPINEGNESKSQIEEYLRDYRGTGVQHIALATADLLDTLDRISEDKNADKIPTLDIDADYYEEAFQRVPQVTEDKAHIQRHQVLIDGDPEGYLLQIFTKNVLGPIFFEFIQRKNHDAFGEGNFTALFKSIERDQERRGVL